ncbi:unnamed protein product [Lactuca virosa]|uniref:Uncharacterized protein n=1 Tax=Lactuca virosa TaxID=75947 RepID=A0AAU9PF31_9ASTR|nr:unnamed protein product [Lactuca virosa]
MYVNNVVLAQEVYFHTVVCNSPDYKNTTINADLRQFGKNNAVLDMVDRKILKRGVAQVMTSLQSIASDSSNAQGSSTLGSVDDFSNDDYSKVKGPKKRGYIRCVGRMSTVKEKVVSCSNDPSVEQLKTMVNVMANIIQKHIPNANLSAVLSNMNIQMPDNTSTVPRNSNSVNQRASSKSHHNNGNC